MELITWSGGDKYEGEWENDERHGQGAYAWADWRQIPRSTWKNEQTNMAREHIPGQMGTSM
jgi:hypothetical protein